MSAQGGSSQCAEAAVELSGVTYRFGEHRAVDDLERSSAVSPADDRPAQRRSDFAVRPTNTGHDV